MAEQDEEKISEGAYRPVLGAPITQAYANAFAIGVSTSDVSVLLNTNGRPHTHLYLSHITAKSLAQALLEGIENFERTVKLTIPTIDDVHQAAESNEQQSV